MNFSITVDITSPNLSHIPLVATLWHTGESLFHIQPVKNLKMSYSTRVSQMDQRKGEQYQW